jgi:regulatory protein
MTPTVTRLRQERPGWVAVELDGECWRSLPAEVVLRAGLQPGVMLDRARAVTVAQERRRLNALRTATSALAHRELTRAELDSRLARRNVAPRDRKAALETVERAGLQDDRRAAHGRAAALAARGYGDRAIRADLEARGVESESCDEALSGLSPEAVRAQVIVERLGRGPRAAQTLARRGFTEDVIEAAVAEWSGSG